MKGLEGLLKEVIEPGLCVACGACVGLCPYLAFYDGKVICTDLCDREEGRCYDVCPRCSPGPLSPPEGSLGPVRRVHRSRAIPDVMRRTGQYGGTVTALLSLALRRGMIRAAVVTSRGGDGSPAGRVVRSEEELLACAGSRYVGSGTLSVYNEEAKGGGGPLGVVGLPCQVQALRKGSDSFQVERDAAGKKALVVGLFCTWALDGRAFARFLEEEGLAGRVSRYDIPPPPAQMLEIMVDGEVRTYPLDRIRPMIFPGCAQCADMTAEEADVSVGTLEGDPDWNTLLVRTEKGEALVERASAEGLIELGELPLDRLRHLEEASLNKRKRGIANQEQRRKR